MLFSASEKIQVISLDEKLPMVDPMQGYRNAVKPGTGKQTELWLNGNDSQTFRYLIRKNGGKGWIQAEIASERGGTDKKKIEIGN